MLSGSLNDRDSFALLRRKRLISFEQFGKANHRIERRTKLMAHIREEDTLRSVRVPRALLRFPKSIDRRGELFRSRIDERL
jgi:hypothetical protein